MHRDLEQPGRRGGRIRRTGPITSIALVLALTITAVWSSTIYADDATPEPLIEEVITLPVENEETPPEADPELVDDTGEPEEDAPQEETGDSPDESVEPEDAVVDPASVTVELLNDTAFGPRGTTVTFDYLVTNTSDRVVVIESGLQIADPSWPVWISGAADDGPISIEAHQSVTITVNMTIPWNVSLLARNQVTLTIESVAFAAEPAGQTGEEGDE